MNRKKSVIVAIVSIILLIIFIEVINLVRLKSQVNRYTAYWQARADQSTPDDALVYVALGDSIAQGIGASSPEKGYVGMLADELAHRSGRPVHVYNYSVSGARITDLINKQLPEFEVLSLPPDAVVTLNIGGNDVVDRIDAKTFAASLDKVLAVLPKNTMVADIGYFGGGRFKSREDKVQEINQVIHEGAKKYGLKQAEVYKITKARDSLKAYAADLFHPSNTGYKNWYDAFFAILTS